MANFIRSAKSGSDWTEIDLEAYNIIVQFQDATIFFGEDPLPPPAVDQELLEVQDADAMVSVPAAVLVNLLDLAMKPPLAGESAVDDFAVALLTVLGYVNHHRVARTRKEVPLLICGERRYANSDICLIGRQQNYILLLVQEDKHFQGDPVGAQCPLVAEAIAAFY